MPYYDGSGNLNQQAFKNYVHFTESTAAYSSVTDGGPYNGYWVYPMAWAIALWVNATGAGSRRLTPRNGVASGYFTQDL